MQQLRPPTLPRRLLLAAVAAALAPRLLRAQDLLPSRDTLVKAAFLHKFASFVEWPVGAFAKADSPLRIGILGDDLVYRDLSELARDRARDGHPVLVTRLSASDPLTGFHILYLKAASPARISDLVATVPEGTLTVADSDGIHPRGSVLSFYLDEGRVRFGVSLEAAAKQKLRLSPKLVAIARPMA